MERRRSRLFSCELVSSFNILFAQTNSCGRIRSATIDPTLFTNYFKDPDSGMLAPTVEVPGQSHSYTLSLSQLSLTEIDSLQVDRSLSRNSGSTMSFNRFKTRGFLKIREDGFSPRNQSVLTFNENSFLRSLSITELVNPLEK